MSCENKHIVHAIFWIFYYNSTKVYMHNTELFKCVLN